MSEKYILPKNEYEKLKSHKSIKPFIAILIDVISLEDDELLEISRLTTNDENETVGSFRKKTAEIINIIRSENRLDEDLSIDLKQLETKLEHLNNRYSTLINRRAREKKPIYDLIKIIFWKLDAMNIGQTKQIKFIYTLYYNNNYQNYRNATTEDAQFALFERIRKDQERAIKE